MSDEDLVVVSDEVYPRKTTPCKACGVIAAFRMRCMKSATRVVVDVTCTACEFTATNRVDRAAVNEMAALWGAEVKEDAVRMAFAGINEQFNIEGKKNR